MLNRNLDINTKVAWHLAKSTKTLPTLPEFLKFIEQRTNALENFYEKVPMKTINIKDHNGKIITTRALLDSGSQINLITDSLIKKLHCKTESTLHRLSVLQGQCVTSKRSTKLNIHSRINSFSRNIHCEIVNKITGNLPSTNIDVTDWKIPNNIMLADHTFNEGLPFELLIGA